MSRAKGHVQDTRRPERLVPHERLVGGVFVPSEVRLPARIDDQQGQSCTGSYGLLVESWAAARGLECDPVSRRFTYTLGRQLAHPDEPIRDLGARPSSVVDGLRDFGVLPETEYPSGDLAQINEPVDFLSLERALTYQVRDVSVIEESGALRCAAIRQALAAQMPVGMGLYVDDAFEAWRGEEVFEGISGAIQGGHAIRVIGHRPNAFLIANSWGTLWGFGGFAWLSDDVIGGPYAFDHYCMTYAPVVKS